VAAEATTPHTIQRLRKVIFLVHILTKQGVLPTSEGGLPTSEGVILTKQGNLREIKPSFCTYKHVANTKFAPKCTFCPKNDLFGPLLQILLLPNGKVAGFWLLVARNASLLGQGDGGNIDKNR
jgi:hypothetical protein